MTSVRTGLLDISYQDYPLHQDDPGTGGLPVLLLHGWPDAARGWHQVVRRLHLAGRRLIVPDLRGSGGTLFHSPDTPRDGRTVALAQDALDLLDALGIGRFAVVGHDWGGRVAYTLAALVPERLGAIAALALAYQPRAEFTMPGFAQARAFWYQWLMYLDDGIEAIRRDPDGFARIQWDTWSPPGWFDDDEFAATAASFANPDWVPITLNAYRARFLPDEPRDTRYDGLRERLRSVEQLAVPTLMIQGGADTCDDPAASQGQDRWFDAPYRRVVIDGVGHFPHREAPATVADLVDEHLARYAVS